MSKNGYLNDSIPISERELANKINRYMYANPIELDEQYRYGKMCKCKNCGLIQKCTKAFDFHPSSIKNKDGKRFLYCFNCTTKTNNRVNKPIKKRKSNKNIPDRFDLL